MGEPGGTLPIIVVLDPPIPYSHFHRGWVYMDLDAPFESREVKYVGSSVASAEDWHLRQKYQPIAQDVFGDDARLKNGQVLSFEKRWCGFSRMPAGNRGLPRAVSDADPARTDG
jgi:hypothetical protein